jgi:DNA-binding NarL/FixJ family response regulator
MMNLNLNSINVIICDDHFFYRQGIRMWLEKKNDINIVGEASDGWELMKLLKHTSPDVILLDINMPVMDGVAALKEIKSLYPTIKVVMLSMNNTEQMIIEMFKLGANAYLTKNDDEKNIYNAIADCYDKGYHFSDRNNALFLKAIKTNPTMFQQPVQQEEIVTPIETPIKPKLWNKVFKILLGSLLTTTLIGILIFLYFYFKQLNTILSFENFTP